MRFVCSTGGVVLNPLRCLDEPRVTVPPVLEEPSRSYGSDPFPEHQHLSNCGGLSGSRSSVDVDVSFVEI